MTFPHAPIPWLLAAVLIMPVAVQAGDAPDATATPAPVAPTAAAVPPIINTMCPMDGKMIDPATATMMPMSIGAGAETKQYRMAMCSAHCCAEFAKDPAAVMKPMFGKSAPGPKTNFK